MINFSKEIHGWSVEKEWVTGAGLKAMVRYNSDGFPHPWRCGYVEVPKEYRLNSCTEDYPSEYDCHGGVTFFDKFDNDDTKWIGFDCNHGFDWDNPKSLEFVVYDCESLAGQVYRREHEGDE